MTLDTDCETTRSKLLDKAVKKAMREFLAQIEAEVENAIDTADMYLSEKLMKPDGLGNLPPVLTRAETRQLRAEFWWALAERSEKRRDGA